MLGYSKLDQRYLFERFFYRKKEYKLLLFSLLKHMYEVSMWHTGKNKIVESSTKSIYWLSKTTIKYSKGFFFVASSWKNVINSLIVWCLTSGRWTISIWLIEKSGIIKNSWICPWIKLNL